MTPAPVRAVWSQGRGALPARPHLAASAAVRRWLSALLVTAPILFYLALSRDATLHHDIWHQMALCREALRLGHLPVSEIFAYSARLGVSMHHEWGAGAVALLLVSAGGGTALMAWKFILMVPVVLSFWLQASSSRALWPAAAVLACFAAPLVSYSNLPVCAQAYSLAFFSLLVWMLHLDRGGNRIWPLFFLPMFVCWVNLHGGFALALAVLLAHTAEQAFRRRPFAHLLAVALCAVGCVAINPYGTAFYSNIVHGLSLQRPIITEWKPFWPVLGLSLRGVLFLFSLGVAAYALWKAGPRRLEGGLMLAFLAVATVRAEKVVPFYAVAWFTVMLGAARFLPPARALRRLLRREPGTCIVALASIAAVCLPFWLAAKPWPLRIPGTEAADRQPIIYPVGPVDYLRAQRFHGNLMTPFEAGAYVSWKLHPAVKVGCDSRYEAAYYPAWVERVAKMYRAPFESNWQQILDQYPTHIVLVPRSAKLDEVLASSPAWRRVYIDDTWRLYARPTLPLPPADRTGQTISGAIP